MVERIVPANLEGDELWQRNGEYVSADHYDAALARVARLERAILACHAAVPGGSVVDPQKVADAIREIAIRVGVEIKT